MSETYARVKETSYKTWKMQQYQSIETACHMPFLPPPFPLAQLFEPLVHKILPSLETSAPDTSPSSLHLPDKTYSKSFSSSRSFSRHSQKADSHDHGRAKLAKNVLFFAKDCQRKFLESKKKKQAEEVSNVVAGTQVGVTQLEQRMDGIERKVEAVHFMLCTLIQQQNRTTS